MTDNSVILTNNHAVTSDCLYNLKASSVSGRSYRASIPPTNGSTFAPSQMMVLNIPARSNCYLDGGASYLKLTIQNPDPLRHMILDSWGACVINSISIFCGGNLLENIINYNVLANILVDTQMNSSTRASLSGMYGTNSVMGDAIIERKGSQINAGKSLTVCIPIISSLFTLSEKYTPLNLADDIRLEIIFEENNKAVVYDATPTVNWKITNAELELVIIELGDEGNSIINSVSPSTQPRYIHSSTYKHYMSTLQANTGGSFSCLVSARCASLKSLWLAPRRSVEIISSTSYSLSSRINPNFTSYWWRVGSLQIPNKPVMLKGGNTHGYAEAYAEMVRALHSMNNTHFSSCLGITEYQVADDADAEVGDGANSGVLQLASGANSYKNGFLIGAELETFSLKSDVMLSGLNCLGSQIFFECTIGANIEDSYTLNFFSFSDVIFVIQDGLINVRN